MDIFQRLYVLVLERSSHTPTPVLTSKRWTTATGAGLHFRTSTYTPYSQEYATPRHRRLYSSASQSGESLLRPAAPGKLCRERNVPLSRLCRHSLVNLGIPPVTHLL